MKCIRESVEINAIAKGVMDDTRVNKEDGERMRMIEEVVTTPFETEEEGTIGTDEGGTLGTGGEWTLGTGVESTLGTGGREMIGTGEGERFEREDITD